MPNAVDTIQSGMTQPDLTRVEEVFQAAADLPGGQRHAYLDGACDGDETLRATVQRLLDRLDTGESLVHPGALPGAGADERGAAGPFPAAAAAEGPGAVIGRYKLLQVIGEGGFGVVYMADQQDPVVRKVALKIIKLGMDTREVVARFEAERQALALMDHPNIARVLDGGATASGRPYFVMELVRGVPITEFCDGNGLSPTERLDLFIDVCRAVQHAHQKGVIHRDLKPSNVLVTLQDGRPVPKVIDFGVAKAMHTRLTEKTLFTRYEQFIGTPAYMSPEQAEMSALDVDTRTDIYSLGVLLYELLTGTTPFDTAALRLAGLAEIQRVIREQEPPRPSVRLSSGGDAAAIARRRRLDPAALCRRVRGDLDWIVMKALEKDRSRRYATASELAEDVRRHLDDEPVLAGPPGAAYRLRKLLARNRAAVVAALLVAAALLVGTITSLVLMQRADHNAELARDQADHALAALDFLVAQLSLADPSVALDPELAMPTLLHQAASGVADAFASQPWAEARVRATIGRAWAQLGENQLAEPHLRRAADLVDTLTGGGRDWTGSPGYGPGEHYATLWRLTNVAFNLESGDAFAVAQRARRAAMAFIGASQPELSAALDRFYSAVESGAWSQEPGAMRDVPALFVAAAASADAALRPADPLAPAVAETFMAAGYMLWYTPNEALAERFVRKALEIESRHRRPDDPEIAKAVELLASILGNLGRGGEAEDLVRDSLESLRRVHREGSFPLALGEAMLGKTLAAQQRFAEAEPFLLASHAVIADKVPDSDNFLVIESLQRLVDLYDGWDRQEQAAPRRDALAATCATGKHLLQWSVTRRAMEPQQAELIAVLEKINEQCGDVSYLVAPAARQAPELAPLVIEAARLRAELLPAETPRAIAVARLFLGWANALDPAGNVESRRLLASEASSILKRSAAEHPVELAAAISVLAETSAPDEARVLAADAWSVLQRAAPDDSWFIVAAEIRIARCLLRQRMFAEAEPALKRGYQVLVAQLTPQGGDTEYTRRLLHELYTAWGRPDEAARYAKAIQPIP